MGIHTELLRGIYAYGFEKPSAIQQRAVMPIINGRDVIAQAQSGTGKTSMIALTVCQMVDISNRKVQALIQAPHACIGGKSVGEDIRKLTGVYWLGIIWDSQGFVKSHGIGNALRMKSKIWGVLVGGF